MKVDLLFFLCFFAILGFVFHIILHEFGHFLAGLVSGWRLLFIQVFYIAITKDPNNGSLSIKKVSSFGCQCIMYPLSLTKNPGFYSLGGIILNFIATIVFLYTSLAVPIGGVSWILSFCFFGCGISMLIFNGIPNSKRVCNDMACFNLCRSDDLTRYFHNVQLIAAKKLSMGSSYRDCNLPSFQCAHSNDILAYQKVLEFYYYLDSDMYQRAGEVIEQIKMDQSSSSGVRKIINLEVAYFALLIDILRLINTDKVDYCHNVDTLIKENEIAGDIHTERVKAFYNAYKFYQVGDIQAGISCLDKAIENIEKMNCLYKGEKVFCLDQLTSIRNIFRRDKFVIG